MKLFERKNQQPPTPDQKMSGRKDHAREAKKKTKDKYNPEGNKSSFFERAGKYLVAKVNSFEIVNMLFSDITGKNIRSNNGMGKDSYDRQDIERLEAEEEMERLLNLEKSPTQEASPDISSDTDIKEIKNIKHHGLNELVLSAENIQKIESQIDTITADIKKMEESLASLNSDYGEAFRIFKDKITEDKLNESDYLEELKTYKDWLVSERDDARNTISQKNLRPSAPEFNKVIQTNLKIEDTDKEIINAEKALIENDDDSINSEKYADSEDVFRLHELSFDIVTFGQQINKAKEESQNQAIKISKDVLEMLNGSDKKTSIQDLYELQMVILPKLKECGVLFTKNKDNIWTFRSDSDFNNKTQASSLDQETSVSEKKYTDPSTEDNNRRFNTSLMKLLSISSINRIVAGDIEMLKSNTLISEPELSEVDLIALKKRIAYGIEIVANKKFAKNLDEQAHSTKGLKIALPDDIKAKSEVFNLMSELSALGIRFVREGSEYKVGLESETTKSDESTNLHEYIPKNNDQILLENIQYAPLPESVSEMAIWQKQINLLTKSDTDAEDIFCIIGSKKAGRDRYFKVVGENQYNDTDISPLTYKFTLPVFDKDDDSIAAQSSRIIIDRFGIRDPRIKPLNVPTTLEQNKINPRVVSSAQSGKDAFYGG